jgi:hypothetical protein
MIETLTRPVFQPLAGMPRRGVVRFVDVPERRLIVFDGEGEPGGPLFQQAVGALYTTGYTLHFALKKAGVEPGPVGMLEGLWERTGAAAGLPMDQPGGDPDDWAWRAMLAAPEAATDVDFAAAIEAAARKKPVPGLDRVRLVAWTEGACVEALHIGPYATEPETVSRMIAAMAEHGLGARGRHHEIYYGDPRRSDPAKLRTVLRQPVE